MKKLSFAMLAIAGVLVSAAPAVADTFSYSLTTVDPTVAPRGPVTFEGSIAAPSSNSGDLLLSDSFSCTGCTLDDTDFFNDVPYPLAPGGSYTGPLFTVTVSNPFATGAYDGTFDVGLTDALGNPIPGTFDSAPFEVTVAPSSVTPEPDSWLLLSTGVAGVGLLRRRFLRPMA